MNSLEELNVYGGQSITVTDNRNATVIFNRAAGIDQSIEITGTTISCQPGIEILQIINYSVSAPKLIVKVIHTAGTFNSTVSWGTLPAYMTVTQSPTKTYTITGMRSEADWELIRNFTWTIPSGYASTPTFYLECKVEYYDANLATTTYEGWNIFDARFYKIADIASEFAMTTNNTRVKRATSAMSSKFKLVGVNGEVLVNMESAFTVNNVAGVKLRRATANLSAISATVATFSNIVRRSTANLTTTAGITARSRVDYRSARAPLVSISNLGFTGSTINATFVYDTTKSAGTTIYLPVQYDPSLDITVNWGDGTSGTFKASGAPGPSGYIEAQHTYASHGTYSVKVSGQWGICQSIYDRTAMNAKLVRVTTFGSLPITNLRGAFQGCSNLIEVPTTIPNNVTQLGYAFLDCTSFNHNGVNSWNVSSVKDFALMFSGCTSFNQNIGGWQPTSAGTDGYTTAMVSMFEGCTSFNQNLSTWHVPAIASKPTNFDYNTPAWVKTNRQPQWGVA